MTYPLVLLLGAGASFPYGVPMMEGFYKEFREHIKRRHQHCFSLLEGFEKEGGHDSPDLETLMSDLHHVLDLEQGLNLLGAEFGAVAEKVAIARELHGYLDAFIVDTCERFDRDRAVQELKVLLDLTRFGPLWIFTTNYDRIIEFACEHHGVLYDDGFIVSGTEPVADWRNRFDAKVRIVKLHGSINWYEGDPGRGLHRLDRGYALPSHDFRLVRGNQELRPLMIIPTLEKQALGDPYVHLAMRFTDVLHETAVLIIAGNSLRDRHIRSYIQGRLGQLNVILVSPRASQRRGVFNNPKRTYALDAGFSELLKLGGAIFSRMGEQLTQVSVADDEAVRVVIETFITDASRNLTDDAVISADPNLAGLFRDSRMGNTPERAAAVRSLSEHPHPAVVRRLVETLESDSEVPVRVTAVSSLAQIHSPEAMKAIASALLRDAAQDVQMEAALALVQETGNDEARGLLDLACKRTDLAPVVRTVIDEALKG